MQINIFKRRSFWLGVVTLTLVALTSAAACGGDDDDASATPTPADTGLATATATRTPGGTPVETAAGDIGEQADCDEADQERGVGGVLTFDDEDATYGSGDDIDITLTIKNCGAEDTTLYFATTQRYDITIEESGSGVRVWSSADDKAFSQVKGEEVVSLTETIVYSETWNQENANGDGVEAGTYKVSAFSVGCVDPDQANCRFGPVKEIVIE